MSCAGGCSQSHGISVHAAVGVAHEPCGCVGDEEPVTRAPLRAQGPTAKALCGPPLFPQRLREPVAEPVPELTRTAEPTPPPELEMDYFKTRVERVMRRRVDAGPPGVTLTNTLSERTMMSGRGLDPKWGTLFLQVDATGQGSTAEVNVFWEVPGGASRWRRNLTPIVVTLGQVNEIPLWSGPLSGPVRWELTLKGGGSVQRFRIVADVVAKHRGSRFDPGMHLHVADPLLAPPRPGPFDPELEREGLSRQRCRPTRDRSSAARQREPPVQPEQGYVEPNERCPQAPPGSRDPSATDWEDRCEADPEVAAYVRNGLTGTLSSTKLSLGPALGLTFTFPDDFASMAARVGTPLTSYVGRHEGFAELWEEVSQGLDEDRVSPAILRNLLSTFGGLPQTSGWSSVDGMVEGGFDVLSPHWTWRGTAIWLDSERLPTWFIISLLNLIKQTTDGLKSEISTETTRNKFLSKKKKKHNRIRASQAKWRLDGVGPPYLNLYPGRKGFAMKSYQGNFDLATMTWTSPAFGASYNNWLGGLPNYRIWNAQTAPLPRPIPSTMVLRPHVWLPYADAAAKLYSLARLLTMLTLRVRADGGGRSEHGQLLNAAKIVYRAYLGCLARPGKTVIHEVFHTIPGAFPASDAVQGAAAWSLVSGFATSAAGLVAVVTVDLVSFFARLKKTGHCPTGCRQEKMAAWWFAKVLARTAFQPVRVDTISQSGFSIYESPLAVDTAATVNTVGSATVASTLITSFSACGSDNGTSVFQGWAILRWPTAPGNQVLLAWYPTTQALSGGFPGLMPAATSSPPPLRKRKIVLASLAKFQRTCANDQGNIRAVSP